MRKEFEQLFLQLLDQAYETSGEPWGAMWFAGAYQPVGKFNAELRVVNEVTFERGGYAIRLHSDNQTLDGVRNTIAVRASDPASQMQISLTHAQEFDPTCWCWPVSMVLPDTTTSYRWYYQATGDRTSDLPANKRDFLGFLRERFVPAPLPETRSSLPPVPSTAMLQTSTSQVSLTSLV